MNAMTGRLLASGRRFLSGLCLCVTSWCFAADSIESMPEAESLRHVLPSVVRIEAIRLRPDQGRLQKMRVGGSGAIISAQGHVVTNYHVAQDADDYQCYLTDGTKLRATLVGQDALTDLAVLQLDLSKRQP